MLKKLQGSKEKLDVRMTRISRKDVKDGDDVLERYIVSLR